MIWIGIIIIIAMLVGLATAVEKIRFGDREEVSWPYITFGMYNWSQVLLLAPVWLMIGLACMFWWTPQIALRAYLLFHLSRGVAEMLQTVILPDIEIAKAIVPKSLGDETASRKSAYLLLQASIVFVTLLFLFGVFP